jgi:hypothetical protein
MPEFEAPNQMLTLAARGELERRLAQCESVRKFDDGLERESAAIADALGDLEKVFRRYVDEWLPQVLAATTAKSLTTLFPSSASSFKKWSGTSGIRNPFAPSYSETTRSPQRSTRDSDPSQTTRKMGNHASRSWGSCGSTSTPR